MAGPKSEAANLIPLAPAEVPARLAELANGWLVFHGVVPPAFDIVADIKRERDERNRRAGGRKRP